MTKIKKFMFSAVLLLAFVLMLYPCLGISIRADQGVWCNGITTVFAFSESQ